MFKQQRRTDRRLVPAAGNGGTRVRIPLAQRRQQADGCTTTEEEEGGEPGPEGGREGGGEGGLGETKRTRLDRTEEAADLTNRERGLGSCGQPAGALGSRPSPNQQEAEHSDDIRAAETVRSLKVTIQQSSDSREFRQTGGLHCHVCELTCLSLQVFQQHMTGSEHLRKLKEMTHSICLNTRTLQDRGRRPAGWCDTCQTHFSDDIIIHRRTKQHKMCKRLCRPFCPVCKRHFRTPRKFVEHMKSAEHKEQVHLEAQEELITVDAVGCFKEEEEGEEGEEEVGEEEELELEEAEVAEEKGEEEGGQEAAEDRPPAEASDTQETDSEEYDPDTTYGSSFVLPVSGFLCRLCNKFFYKETTARHTHCRTHTHYLNLQGHRAQRREDRSALS